MISTEMEELEVKVCRELAQRFMTGTRDGSKRPTWRHAEDVAGAVGGVWLEPPG